MDRWDIEKAVTLLRESIDNGIIPNQGVVINLLQMLGMSLDSTVGSLYLILSSESLLVQNDRQGFNGM
jgi:hypothetical protein